MVKVAPLLCGMCGGCVGVCPTTALSLAEAHLLVEETACIDCGLCLPTCPTGALSSVRSPPKGTTAMPQKTKAIALGARPGFLRSSYDIVVIGAGPGGAMAAWRAAQAGCSVLLLEKRQEIGSPVRCAEGVGHEPLSRFIDPNPHWIAATVTSASITVVEEGERRLVMRRSGATGYILERRIFDRVLAQEAAAAGAQVVTKCPAIGLLRENGQVIGVRVLWQGQEMSIGAKVVIAADGVESLTARWAGLDTTLPLRDTMSCAQFLLAGIDLDPTCCAYYLGESIAPGGYIWVFPKGENQANVGIGIQADLARRPALAYLTDFIAATPSLAQGSILTQVFGVVPVAAPSPSLIADGLMVIGDAARQVDPLTGGGITNAMTAGDIAGRVAAQACAAGDTSAAGLTAYPARFHAVLGRRLERNYRLKERYAAARTGQDFLRIFALAVAGM